MLEEQNFIPYSTSSIPPGPYLIFAPHPDDEIFGMGGTISLASSRGIRVHVVVMTDGALGGDPKIRKKETETAGRILGISEIHFLDLPDRKLCDIEVPSDQIAGILEQVKPETIFLPALQEFHPDHRATTKAVLEILKDLSFSGTIWFYEISRQSEINRLVDITRTVHSKVEAVRCFRSQLSQNDYEAVALGINHARSYTLGPDITHAEGFWTSNNADIAAIVNSLEQAIKLYFPKISHSSPKVSIIIRTKNRPHLLKDALESVSLQTYKDIEVVVVNDGGTDVSHLIENFQGKIEKIEQVSYFRSLGRAAAANRGIEAAKGDWIGFLDDDDLLEPSALEMLLSETKKAETRVVYGQVLREHYLNDGSRDTSMPNYLYARPFNRHLLYLQNYIPFIALLFHRDVISECGPIDEELSLNEDWSFLLRVADRHDFRYIPKLVARYRCFGAATAVGGRFNQDQILESENKIRRQWWGKVTSESIHSFRRYVSEEIAKQYLSEIKGLKDSGNELQRECETHRLLTKKLNEQISNVQRELDYLKSQLALMKNSISWKITRPLRKIRRFQMQINEHSKSNITKKKRLRKIVCDHAPKISIITPVFNPRESDFRQMLASIMAQTYQNWELCLADDASSASHVKRLIEEFGSKEPRVKVTFRATRGHISEASNSAIDLASGEFLALVDHDDLLEPTALEEVARCLKTYPDVDIVYTDEDTVLPDGTLGTPYLKPTWSPDLFLSNMYTCHLGVYRRSLVEEVGKFRSGFEGSQDYDLVLRLTERVRKICHLPEVLYHWRCSPTSTALNLGNKEYAFEAGKRALEEALSRRGEIGSVKHVPGYPGHYRVHYEPGTSYSVAVFLGGNPSGGQVECLGSLQAPNGPISEIYFQDETWSKNGLPDNRLVQHAKAEILFFLNASLRPKDPGWLREMSSYAKRPQVGVVAGTWTNIAGKIVHSGLILNTADLWSLSHLGYPCDDIGYFGRLIDISNYSAVGYEGLMVEKRKFLEVYGFDENLHNAKGVDLCLKLLSKGYYNVVLPHIRFHWTDDGLMPSLPENVGDCFSQKWRGMIDSDPFYHPGFNRKEGLFKPDTNAFSNFVPRCTLVANRAK